MINTQVVNMQHAYDCLLDRYEAGDKTPVFLSGPPGVGKTSLVEQLGKLITKKYDKDFRVVTQILSQLDPTDLRGLPKIDVENEITRWFQAEFLPKSGDSSSGILFLDELGNAQPRVQVAANQLLLERRIGNYKLPDGWWVIGAGNRVEDGSYVFEMASTMADRLTFLSVDCSPQDWLDWAGKSGVTPEVLTFIKTKPDFLNSIQGQDKGDRVISPTPRSWEAVSNQVKTCKNKAILKTLVSGRVGDATAIEFWAVLEEIQGLPPIERIIEMNADQFIRAVPHKTAALYGLVYSLIPYVTDEVSLRKVFNVFLHFPKVGEVSNIPGEEMLTFAMSNLLKSIRVNNNENLTQALIGFDEFKESYKKRTEELVGV